ncbi:MAG: diacylglycerol kinase family protein [Bdellovibrionota bacterium]
MNEQMQIGVLYNPYSGQGRAKLLADAVAAEAARRGLGARLIESQKSYEDPAKLMEGLDALIVSGGDGTVMPLLEAYATTGTAFAMIPAGNESLIARAFKMTSRPSEVIDRVVARNLTKHFFAYANDRPFFLMAGVGLDSVVIEAIHRQRKGPVGHIGYFLPTLRCLVRYVPPVLRISSGGQVLVDNVSGHCIVANRREYARRLDPVPEADSSVGELVLRFYPEFGKRNYLGWLPQIVRALPVDPTGSLLFRANSFSIESGDGRAFSVQVDGDPLGALPLKVRSSEHCISVL